MTALLERRFDNVIFRLGLARSRDQARQLIGHNHFLINHKKVNIPSYQLKSGDLITLRPHSVQNMIIQDNLKVWDSQVVPDWLMFEPKKMQGQIIRLPADQELEIGVDMRLIIGFYSR